MKIYAAIISYDHEGSSILGIFETQERAKRRCQNDQDSQFSESSELLEWFDRHEGWIYAKSTAEYACYNYDVEEHEVAK